MDFKEELQNIKDKTGLNSDQKFADFFGVGRATVARIKNGDGKKHLLAPYFFINLACNELTTEQIVKIMTIMEFTVNSNAYRRE